MNIKKSDVVPSKGAEQKGLMENSPDSLNIRLSWQAKLERNDKTSEGINIGDGELITHRTSQAI